MGTLTDPRLLTWTVPTPRGLWYRAFIVIDHGMFITPDIDTSTLDALKTTAAGGARELVAVLTSHGRFKRSKYVAWSSITALHLNPTTGMIDIEVRDGETVSVSIADRERCEKMARVLVKSWKAQTESV